MAAGNGGPPYPTATPDPHAPLNPNALPGAATTMQDAHPGTDIGNRRKGLQRNSLVVHVTPSLPYGCRLRVVNVMALVLLVALVLVVVT